MSKDEPDHHDAEIVMRLYDLRREPVMRESREALNTGFWPGSYDRRVVNTLAFRNAEWVDTQCDPGRTVFEHFQARVAKAAAARAAKER